jgi:hypothetical protein
MRMFAFTGRISGMGYPLRNGFALTYGRYDIVYGEARERKLHAHTSTTDNAVQKQ